MQKVIDYKVIYGDSPQDLTIKVGTEMEQNWVPSGTVVAYGEGLVQSTVKFEETQES